MDKSFGIDILLVEDNSTDAEMTIRALRDSNISNTIQHVEDGAAALDFIYCRGSYANRDAQRHPSLILLDLKLPKLDGFEVLKVLKTDPDKKTIPIVVLTSSSEERDIVDTYQLGVNSYIVKPVDFKQFASSIRELGMYWLVLNKQ